MEEKNTETKWSHIVNSTMDTVLDPQGPLYSAILQDCLSGSKGKGKEEDVTKEGISSSSSSSSNNVTAPSPAPVLLTPTNLRIRRGTKEDCSEIYRLICGLALYEKEPISIVKTNVEILEKDGFGPEPSFYVLVVENPRDPTGLIGMALFFFSYSTWQGKFLYLEDLFIEEGYRGQGIGKSVFAILRKLTTSLGCGRFQWQVLDWNTPARDFYTNTIGATELLDPTWVTVRLEGETLK